MDSIQRIIKRMASNSFMLKGGAVTLMEGIFALESKDTDKRYSFIDYILLII